MDLSRINPTAKILIGFLGLALFLTAPPLHAAFQLDWSSQTPPTGRSGHTLTSFNGKLWAIGGFHAPGDVWSSADGTTWRRLQHRAPFGLRAGHAAAVFHDRLWVLGGLTQGQNLSSYTKTNAIWSTADGLTWDSHTTQTAFTARYDHAVLEFNNKLWIIGGVDGAEHVLNDVWSSDNGIEWTRVTAAASFTPNRNHPAFVADGRMWTIGPGSEVWSSTNGSQWERSADVSDVLLTDPVCVRLGNRILSIHSYEPTEPGKTWVFAKQDGQTTWTQIAFDIFDGQFKRFEAASHNGRLWLVGSDVINDILRGKVFSSSDGKNWVDPNATAFPAGIGAMTSIAPFKDLLIANMNTNRFPSIQTLWVTATGTKWEMVPGDLPFMHDGAGDEEMVAFKDRLFVIEPFYILNATQGGGKVWSSSDLYNWKLETANLDWPTTMVLQTSFVFQNQIWIGGDLVGFDPHTQFWRSADGAAWQAVNINGDVQFGSGKLSSVVSEDGIRIFPDYPGDAGYFSPDGFHWSSFGTADHQVVRVGQDWLKLHDADRHPNFSTIFDRFELFQSSNALDWTLVPSTYGPYPSPSRLLYFKNRLWTITDGTVFATIYSTPWPQTSAGDWNGYD